MKPEVGHEQIEMQLLLPFLKEMLAEGREIKMTVTGNSMYPLLRDRQDSVLLTTTGQPKKFDIALFVRTNGEAVLHRIVACGDDGFIMLGDNQYEKEGPIGPEQIVAVAKGFYRGTRFIPFETWWCRLYTFIWGNACGMRRVLKPFVIWVGKMIKRAERME
ncbi:MAG: S24 family peptidase [Clostridia bacterium]|nr:S24 family peptidase [Clostridia bacterium]